MQLWQRLYAMVWLTFLTCTMVPRWFGKYMVIVHVVLGVLILVLALANKKALAAKPVPDRLKRISVPVAGLATAQLVLGLTLGGLMHWQELPSWVASVLDGFHVVFSLTMLAQSASLATGYDMWEEKEIGPAPAAASAAEKPAEEKKPS